PPTENPLTPLTLGDLTLDLARREVRRAGAGLPLTKTEFELLRELALHADKVLTYSHLLNAVWGPAYDDPHLIHVHLGNLRRKLQGGPAGPRYIISLPGVGYRLRRDA